MCILDFPAPCETLDQLPMHPKPLSMQGRQWGVVGLSETRWPRLPHHLSPCLISHSEEKVQSVHKVPMCHIKLKHNTVWKSKQCPYYRLREESVSCQVLTRILIAHLDNEKLDF
jgi:hypothetical protein